MIKLHNRKGKRSPLFYAVWASPGIGVASGLLGLVTAIGGYDGTQAVKTASANMSIILSYTLLPALLYAIAALALRKFDLEKHLPEIQAELKKEKKSNFV